MCEENRIPYECCQTQSATSPSVCDIINIETAAHAALTGEHFYASLHCSTVSLIYTDCHSTSFLVQTRLVLDNNNIYTISKENKNENCIC